MHNICTLIFVIAMNITYSQESVNLIVNDSIFAVGELKMNKKNGVWDYYLIQDSSIVYKCNYSLGVLEGFTVKYYPNINKIKYIGNFEDGLLNGELYCFSLTGNLIANYSFGNGIMTTVNYIVIDENKMNRSKVFYPFDDYIEGR